MWICGESMSVVQGTVILKVTHTPILPCALLTPLLTTARILPLLTTLCYITAPLGLEFNLLFCGRLVEASECFSLERRWL